MTSKNKGRPAKRWRERPPGQILEGHGLAEEDSAIWRQHAEVFVQQQEAMTAQ